MANVGTREVKKMEAAQPDTFLINFWLVTWVVFGVVGGAITNSRMANFGTGFWLGLLLGPIGLIICFFVGSEKR